MDLEASKHGGFNITAITPAERDTIADHFDAQSGDPGEARIIQALIGLVVQTPAPIEISFANFEKRFPETEPVRVDRTVARFGLELEEVPGVTVNFPSKEARRDYRRRLNAPLVNNAAYSRIQSISGLNRGGHLRDFSIVNRRKSRRHEHY